MYCLCAAVETRHLNMLKPDVGCRTMVVVSLDLGVKNVRFPDHITSS